MLWPMYACTYASNNSKLQHPPSSFQGHPSTLDIWTFVNKFVEIPTHTKEKIVVKNALINIFVEGKIRDLGLSA